MDSVEKILNYSFVNKTLLKEALSQTSKGSVESSIQFDRLEFLGDSVLKVAFTNYIHHAYRNLKLKKLRELRAANVSNEKFARVAVKHNLYQIAIGETPHLSEKEKVKEFTEAVSKEDEPVPFGGLVKAPRILAHIVESIAAAVYIDVNCDVQRLWEIVRGLFEPIYTPDDLRRQPKPPLRLADKHGKRIDFRYSKDEDSNENIAEVYLDDMFIASGCAKRIDTAKLLAAEEALEKLSDSMPIAKIIDEDSLDVKRKLIEICSTEKLRLQTGSSSLPIASENPLTYEMTPNKKVIDEDSLRVEPEDVKEKLVEICSTEKLQLPTNSASLPTVSEKHVRGNLPEICSTEKLQRQTGSSSLPTKSENPLTDEMTEEQMAIDEDTPHAEPVDVKGKSLEICSTEKLQTQTGLSSFPTASENPLTDEMTEKQMVIDEDSLHAEPEDVNGRSLEICSTEKFRLQTESSSLSTASKNPLTDEMKEEQMVIDEDSPHVEPYYTKQMLLEICDKNKWPRPIFSVEEVRRPKNRKKNICSVKIEIPTIEGTFHMKGDAQVKKKQAESSSAYHMIRALTSSPMSFAIRDLKLPKSLYKKKKENLQMQETLDENTNLHSKKRRTN